MSKIESRTYFVSENCIEDIKEGKQIKSRYLTIAQGYDSDVKVTFSWEAPEKVVTISESEFDEVRTMLGYDNSERDKVLNRFKEKLFKDKV